MGELTFCCPTASKNKLPEKSARNLLISVPNDARTDYQISKVKEMFRYLKKQFVIQDSGGFTVLQEANKGKRITSNPDLPLKISKDSMNIAPEHIIEAAVKLRPDILESLDFPINKVEDRREQRQEFSKKLLYNVLLSLNFPSLSTHDCAIPLEFGVGLFAHADGRPVLLFQPGELL